MAICSVALAGVVLALAFAENAAVMSMASLGEAYAKANAAKRERLEIVRIMAASARNWPHFLARVFDGVTIFVFCAVLFRSALIPRAISGFGLIAAVSQILGIGVALFGHDVIFPMMAPLGSSLLTLGVRARGKRPSESAGNRRRAGTSLTALRAPGWCRPMPKIFAAKEVPEIRFFFADNASRFVASLRATR